MLDFVNFPSFEHESRLYLEIIKPNILAHFAIIVRAPIRQKSVFPLFYGIFISFGYFPYHFVLGKGVFELFLLSFLLLDLLFKLLLNFIKVLINLKITWLCRFKNTLGKLLSLYDVSIVTTLRALCSSTTYIIGLFRLIGDTVSSAQFLI